MSTGWGFYITYPAVKTPCRAGLFRQRTPVGAFNDQTRVRSLRESSPARLYTAVGSGCLKDIFRRDGIVSRRRVVLVGGIAPEDSVAKRSVRTVPGHHCPVLGYYCVFRTRGVVARMPCLSMVH